MRSPADQLCGHHKTNNRVIMTLFWMALGAQHNLQGGKLAASIFLCDSHNFSSLFTSYANTTLSKMTWPSMLSVIATRQCRT